MINNILEISEERNFGFKYNEKEIKFLVPEQLYFKDLDNQYDMFSILQLYSNLLLKYSKSTKSKINNKFNFNHSGLVSIVGYINLIVDFFKHGCFFVEKKRYNKKTKKNINWKKTFNSKKLLIQNQNVIFNELISNDKEINQYNDFVNIYKKALNNAFVFFGIKKRINCDNKNYNINNIKKIISNHEYCNFSNRDYYIIQSLKSIYLQGNFKDFGSKNINCFFHTKFEFIWEDIIENIIPKDKKIKTKYIPKGKYIRFSDKSVVDGAHYKLDHLVVSENSKSIHVLDSKFYKYYFHGKPPKTESISKQENYKNLVKEVNEDYKDFEFYNYFIFPKNNSGESVEYFAKHEIEIKNKKIQIIHCIAFNIHKAIQLYLESEESKELYNIVVSTID